MLTLVEVSQEITSIQETHEATMKTQFVILTFSCLYRLMKFVLMNEENCLLSHLFITSVNSFLMRLWSQFLVSILLSHRMMFI